MAKTRAKSKPADGASTEASGEGIASFENSLSELEQLVERLESGEQSLETALKDFERGIVLTRQCQQSLQAAELRVQQLLQRNGKDSLEDFESDDEA